MSGYRLYLDPCGDDLQCIVPVSGRETISHEYSTSICDGRSYSFSVQSINDCGAGGPNSSLVRQTCGEYACACADVYVYMCVYVYVHVCVCVT